MKPFLTLAILLGGVSAWAINPNCLYYLQADHSFHDALVSTPEIPASEIKGLRSFIKNKIDVGQNNFGTFYGSYRGDKVFVKIVADLDENLEDEIRFTALLSEYGLGPGLVGTTEIGEYRKFGQSIVTEFVDGFFTKPIRLFLFAEIRFGEVPSLLEFKRAIEKSINEHTKSLSSMERRRFAASVRRDHMQFIDRVNERTLEALDGMYEFINEQRVAPKDLQFIVKSNGDLVFIDFGQYDFFDESEALQVAYASATHELDEIYSWVQSIIEIKKRDQSTKERRRVDPFGWLRSE